MAAWESLVGVIVLAGGSSRRMGRDKLVLRRDGVALIGLVLEGVHRELLARSSPASTIVVGPRPTVDIPHTAGFDIAFTREEPPGGGPLAALAAGISQLASTRTPDPVVVALAGDAPRGPHAMGLLIDSIDPDHDAAILTDTHGRRQPLCAAYRLQPLRDALADIGEHTGRSMTALVDQVRYLPVPDTVDAALDIDTPEDAQRHGFTEGWSAN